MPQAELWGILGVATVVLLVGASLMGCYMVPQYRKTFYQVMRVPLGSVSFSQVISTLPIRYPTPRLVQHKSFKAQIMWIWDERTCCVSGDGQDASRADALGFATWAWPPNERVRRWLENWERWEREKPAW